MVFTVPADVQAPNDTEPDTGLTTTLHMLWTIFLRWLVSAMCAQVKQLCGCVGVSLRVQVTWHVVWERPGGMMSRVLEDQFSRLRGRDGNAIISDLCQDSRRKLFVLFARKHFLLAELTTGIWTKCFLQPSIVLSKREKMKYGFFPFDEETCSRFAILDVMCHTFWYFALLSKQEILVITVTQPGMSLTSLIISFSHRFVVAVATDSTGATWLFHNGLFTP